MKTARHIGHVKTMSEINKRHERVIQTVASPVVNNFMARPQQSISSNLSKLARLDSSLNYNQLSQAAELSTKHRPPEVKKARLEDMGKISLS